MNGRISDPEEAKGCAGSSSLPGRSKSPVKSAPQRSSKRKAPASGKTFRKNAREQKRSDDYCAIQTCGVLTILPEI